MPRKRKKSDMSGRFLVGDKTAPTYHSAIALAQNTVVQDDDPAAKLYVREIDGKTVALVERIEKIVYTRRLK